MYKNVANYQITVNSNNGKLPWETRRVQFFCANGKVQGAQKFGNIYVMSKGTPKPIDGRTKAAKQHNEIIKIN